MSHVRRLLWVAGTPARGALIAFIRVYRYTLSGVLGGQCRFYPSCSHYGEEAVRTHGALKGVALASWRVLRCSPLTSGGVDHVPPRRQGHPAAYEPVIHKGAEAC